MRVHSVSKDKCDTTSNSRANSILTVRAKALTVKNDNTFAICEINQIPFYFYLFFFLTLKGLLLNSHALEYNSVFFKQLLCVAHLACLVQP